MALGPLGDIGPCQIYWNSTVITSLLEGGATFRFTGGVSPDVKEAEFGNTHSMVSLLVMNRLSSKHHLPDSLMQIWQR